jgi:hypothetical protein
MTVHVIVLIPVVSTKYRKGTLFIHDCQLNDCPAHYNALSVLTVDSNWRLNQVLIPRMNEVTYTKCLFDQNGITKWTPSEVRRK